MIAVDRRLSGADDCQEADRGLVDLTSLWGYVQYVLRTDSSGGGHHTCCHPAVMNAMSVNLLAPCSWQPDAAARTTLSLAQSNEDQGNQIQPRPFHEMANDVNSKIVKVGFVHA